MFLFWSAAWCPPCNQVKSTIFTRQDFIDKSRSFVPVYVDGDTPSGQALGKRFSVGAYPTMVLLRPDGSEITRLAGSVEPAKYMQVLEHGIAGGSSARQALAAAMAGTPVAAEDWRLLAFYSWETDEQQIVPKAEVPATLLKLAQACPPEQSEASSRLVLQAIAASATAKGDVKPAADKADALASLQSILARPELVREHYDLIAGYASQMVAYTTAPKSKAREQLLAQWNVALDSTGGGCHLVERRPDLGAGRQGRPGPARQQVRPASQAAAGAGARAGRARADRETTDINERQSVITSAGARAGRCRAARRVRCPAVGGTRALAFTVLLHARPRFERPQARNTGKQGRRDRVGSSGLRDLQGSGDAPAVGRRLCQLSARARPR